MKYKKGRNTAKYCAMAGTYSAPCHAYIGPQLYRAIAIQKRHCAMAGRIQRPLPKNKTWISN